MNSRRLKFRRLKARPFTSFSPPTRRSSTFRSTNPTIVYVQPASPPVTPFVTFAIGIGIGALIASNQPWGWNSWGWGWGPRGGIYYHRGSWGGVWVGGYHPPHYYYHPRPPYYAGRPGYGGNWGYRPHQPSASCNSPTATPAFAKSRQPRLSSTPITTSLTPRRINRAETKSPPRQITLVRQATTAAITAQLVPTETTGIRAATSRHSQMATLPSLPISPPRSRPALTRIKVELVRHNLRRPLQSQRSSQNRLRNRNPSNSQSRLRSQNHNSSQSRRRNRNPNSNQNPLRSRNPNSSQNPLRSQGRLLNPTTALRKIKAQPPSGSGFHRLRFTNTNYNSDLCSMQRSLLF